MLIFFIVILLKFLRVFFNYMWYVLLGVIVVKDVFGSFDNVMIEEVNV